MTELAGTPPSTGEGAGRPAPVAEGGRIESLDVIRGFALLGILLLNVLGFGLYAAGYFNPLVGSGTTELSHAVNLGVWAGVDVLFEGAMRCLFSMLFGAGVVLFTTGAGAKSAGLHYRRNFWLLAFGLFDAYLLLWNGDILVTYALAGMALYPLRNAAPQRLLIGAGVLVVLMSLLNVSFSWGLGLARDAALSVESAPEATDLDPLLLEGAAAWHDFLADYEPAAAQVTAELEARRGSYASAFSFNAAYMVEVLTFTLPVITFWDALAMMLLGMALYRWGVLDGSRSIGFYANLAVWGFAVGLLVNLWELWRVIASGFDPLAAHGYMRPTYHFGRLGMALGYVGVVMLVCRMGTWPALRARLAAVGRMALSNYLLHSVIALFLFTGAGLGLVGVLERWQLYVVVFAIWALQLVVSPWWLARYRFGPAEWLWRALTYGQRPPLAR